MQSLRTLTNRNRNNKRGLLNFSDVNAEWLKNEEKNTGVNHTIQSGL
jgi:hypothetical protein